MQYPTPEWLIGRARREGLLKLEPRSLSSGGRDSGLLNRSSRGHGTRELTGRRRNRLFVYDRYLAILNEGTEVV
jgi:hypothetical protein